MLSIQRSIKQKRANIMPENRIMNKPACLPILSVNAAANNNGASAL